MSDVATVKTAGLDLWPHLIPASAELEALSGLDLATESYRLLLPAGKKVTFTCDFHASYEHTLNCVSDLDQSVTWRNRAWQGEVGARTPAIIYPVSVARHLIFSSFWKHCHYDVTYPGRCTNSPWNKGLIALIEETATLVRLAWGETQRPGFANAEVRIEVGE